MGYPQVTSQSYAGPSVGVPVQEPVMAMLAQALQQFEDVERRFIALRDRIEIGPSEKLGQKTAEAPPNGMVKQANELRNVSARLQELCLNFENTI